MSEKLNMERDGLPPIEQIYAEMRFTQNRVLTIARSLSVDTSKAHKGGYWVKNDSLDGYNAFRSAHRNLRRYILKCKAEDIYTNDNIIEANRLHIIAQEHARRVLKDAISKGFDIDTLPTVPSPVVEEVRYDDGMNEVDPKNTDTISGLETQEIDVYTKIRNRYMTMKGEVGLLVDANEATKQTAAYKSYQRQASQLELLVKDKDSITQNHSLIQELFGILKREVVKMPKETALVPQDDSWKRNFNGGIDASVPDGVERLTATDKDKITVHTGSEWMKKEAARISQGKRFHPLDNGKVIENTDPSRIDVRNNSASYKRLAELEDQETVTAVRIAQEEEAAIKVRADNIYHKHEVDGHKKIEKTDVVKEANTEKGISDGTDTGEKKRGWWQKAFVTEQEEKGRETTKKAASEQSDVDVFDKDMKGFESQSTASHGPKNRVEEERENAAIDAQEAKFNFDHQTAAEQRNQDAFDKVYGAKNSESGGTHIHINTGGGDVLGNAGEGHSIRGSVFKSEGLASIVEPIHPIVEATETETTEETAETETTEAEVTVEAEAAEVEAIVETDVGVPPVSEIGAGYVEPDLAILGQEDWKQFTSNEKIYSQEDAPPVKLFGSHIPKAGPEGVHGARAFGWGLEIPKHKYSKIDSPEAKAMVEKLDEAISLTRSAPAAGLTDRQVRQLEALAKEIDLPEHYLTYSKALGVAESALDNNAAKKVAEKIPAIAAVASKEKKRRKRGILGRLGFATLFAVFASATATGDDGVHATDEMNKKTSPNTVLTPKFPHSHDSITDVPKFTVDPVSISPDTASGVTQKVAELSDSETPQPFQTQNTEAPNIGNPVVDETTPSISTHTSRLDVVTPEYPHDPDAIRNVPEFPSYSAPTSRDTASGVIPGVSGLVDVETPTPFTFSNFENTSVDNSVGGEIISSPGSPAGVEALPAERTVVYTPEQITQKLTTGFENLSDAQQFVQEVGVTGVDHMNYVDRNLFIEGTNLAHLEVLLPGLKDIGGKVTQITMHGDDVASIGGQNFSNMATLDKSLKSVTTSGPTHIEFKPTGEIVVSEKKLLSTHETIYNKQDISSKYIPPSEIETKVDIPPGDISSVYTPINPETVEKQYRVKSTDNVWNYAEGDVEGIGMSPELLKVPKERRNAVLAFVRAELIDSAEWRKKVGITSGNPDVIYPYKKVNGVVHGDTLNGTQLDLLIKHVIQKRNIL